MPEDPIGLSTMVLLTLVVCFQPLLRLEKWSHRAIPDFFDSLSDRLDQFGRNIQARALRSARRRRDKYLTSPGVDGW